jgi:hypothetical protein
MNERTILIAKWLRLFRNITVFRQTRSRDSARLGSQLDLLEPVLRQLVEEWGPPSSTWLAKLRPRTVFW